MSHKTNSVKYNRIAESVYLELYGPLRKTHSNELDPDFQISQWRALWEIKEHVAKCISRNVKESMYVSAPDPDPH